MTTAILLALALTSQSGGPRKAPTKVFVSKEGGFSAAMPGTPKLQNQTVQTPIGPLEIHLYVLEGSDLAYFVTYNDYAADFVAKADPKALLTNGQNGAITTVKGKLIVEEEIELDGHPGRAFTFALPEGDIPDGMGKARHFLVRNRHYQVMVVGTKAKIEDKATDKFLKSFKLTGAK